MKTGKVKVVAVESAKKGRWHFATSWPSVANPGRLNLSVRTWASKRSALRAGEREYRFVRI